MPHFAFFFFHWKEQIFSYSALYRSKIKKKTLSFQWRIISRITFGISFEIYFDNETWSVVIENNRSEIPWISSIVGWLLFFILFFCKYFMCIVDFSFGLVRSINNVKLILNPLSQNAKFVHSPSIHCHTILIKMTDVTLLIPSLPLVIHCHNYTISPSLQGMV